VLKTFLLKDQSWGRMEDVKATLQLSCTSRFEQQSSNHGALPSARLIQWYKNFLKKLIFHYPDNKFPASWMRNFIPVQIQACHLENPEPVNFGSHFHPLFTYFLSKYALRTHVLSYLYTPLECPIYLIFPPVLHLRPILFSFLHYPYNP